MSAPANTPWTDARVATLKRMWAEGFTAAVIAGRLGAGITRNAVIGKVQRLGLGEHPNARNRLCENMPRAPRKPAQRRKVPKTVIATLEAVSATSEPPVARQPAVEPVTIEDLRFPIRQCRWIDGEPKADALYCGAKVRDGASYCPEHHARMWRLPKQSEVAA